MAFSREKEMDCKSDKAARLHSELARELPGFPQPVKIRGRNYDYTRLIQRWKREQAAGGAAA